LPVIDSRGTRPIISSGDLAFLQQKEQEGKLKSARGTLSTTGTLCSITAGTNRDLYLSSAKVIFYLNVLNTLSSVADKVELQLNGVTIETATHSTITASGVATFEYEFKNISRKVLAGEDIRLQVTVLDTDIDVEGFIQGWEESSGSQQFGGQTLTIQSEGGDLSFLRDKEKAGDLVKILSPEFSTNADQVTFIPPNGKTFFFSRARLYPVVDTITLIQGSLGNTQLTRRADIEITNNGTIVDVLTHDHHSRQADADMSSGTKAGQYESNIFDSLVGDGIKEFKLVSTNTSGTFRVSLFGWLEDT